MEEKKKTMLGNIYNAGTAGHRPDLGRWFYGNFTKSTITQHHPLGRCQRKTAIFGPALAIPLPARPCGAQTPIAGLPCRVFSQCAGGLSGRAYKQKSGLRMGAQGASGVERLALLLCDWLVCALFGLAQTRRRPFQGPPPAVSEHLLHWPVAGACLMQASQMHPYIWCSLWFFSTLRLVTNEYIITSATAMYD